MKKLEKWLSFFSGSIISKIGHSNKREKTQRYEDALEKDKSYTREKVLQFAEEVRANKNKLKEKLKQLKSEGKTIYAFGAPAKGNTLLNYFEIDNTLIGKAVEINDMKLDLYLPGSHIPIEKEDPSDQPDYFLLLSHNFADEIVKKNKGSSTEFIIPFTK